MKHTLPFLTALLLAPLAALATEEFTLEAKDFDDGNVTVSLVGQSYADAHSCIWDGRLMPNRVEYVIEFPVTADYPLLALYAAQQSRPVEISVDGKVAHKGFAGVTGSWMTKSAKWEKQCTLRIERGQHSIVLQRDGPFPHICALRLQSPGGAKLKRLSPEQRAERARQARARAQLAMLKGVNLEAVQLAIDDLEKSFPGAYDATTHCKAVAAFDQQRAGLVKAGKEIAPATLENVMGGIRAALLANPLLDFDKLLVVRRAPATSTGFLGANYLCHASMPRAGYDNEIAILSNLRGMPNLERLYKPSEDRLLRDVRLDFNGERMLFSSLDDNRRWGIFQIRSDGSGLEQLTPRNFPDLDFFDACYLPDGRIVVASTANYFGVPCLSGGVQVSSLYLLDPATKNLRQLTFDQDHANDPVALNDGRLSYQRWEYSDIPHYFSRRRMSMNPDGTGQLALYGSNSWFPTAFRFAKPVPDHPTRMIGIISGHHDHADCGRMALMDPALASGYPFRYRPASKEWGVEGELIAVTPDILPVEQTGFLQLIPSRGKPVAGTVCDAIIKHHYLNERPSLTTHPHPLSSKYFLVSMKPTAQSLWGIYLIDVFDNATLIAEFPGAALFEPQPLVARPRPPVIPDRIVAESRMAEVHIADIYRGQGLQGVPRGAVKSLRVFAYHFGYLNKSGFELIGIHSGWDVKRVLGTATVEADGSACFQIPANTPVSLHPYVRRAGVESDMALLNPMEYHASTSLLLQMLEKGHHGVTLAGMDREARERIYCWIDLNVPRIGSWDPPGLAEPGAPNRPPKPVDGKVPPQPPCEFDQRQRRLELSRLLANNDNDAEGEFRVAEEAFKKRTPVPFAAPPAEKPVEPDGLKAAAASSTPAPAPGVIELGGGLKVTFVQIPAGEFVMGSLDGAPDERPRSLVRIAKPFWMSVTEITNAQFARFAPEHDTRYVDMHYMDHTVPGHIANHPDQPVARVSWQEAMQFCDWLSQENNLRVTLPTEAQWEYAARAGTGTQFFYGTLDSDFGRFANLADQSLRWYRMTYDGPSALPRRYEYPPEMNFPLHDGRFRDRWHVVDYVGQTEPNAWGLRDMVGNVSEWTRSSYRPYPCREDDSSNGESPAGRKAVRGGSWADRPADAGSSVRRAYEPWQKVHDVGFRIVCEEEPREYVRVAP